MELYQMPSKVNKRTMKKIMFNDTYGLTDAVLRGRKTMTRRICGMTLRVNITGGIMKKIEPIDMIIACNGTALFQIGRNREIVPNENQPAYKVGEEVAIAQPYKVIARENRKWLDLQLAANGQSIGELMHSKGWENKMFVRSCYCPNHIRITGVKAERLQSISDVDIIREGIYDCMLIHTRYRYYFDSMGDVPYHVTLACPRLAFYSLIDKLCKPGTWERNPWVYAYTFELVRSKLKDAIQLSNIIK